MPQWLNEMCAADGPGKFRFSSGRTINHTLRPRLRMVPTTLRRELRNWWADSTIQLSLLGDNLEGESRRTSSMQRGRCSNQKYRGCGPKNSSILGSGDLRFFRRKLDDRDGVRKRLPEDKDGMLMIFSFDGLFERLRDPHLNAT